MIQQPATKISLQDARAQLRVPQRVLAERARLSITTVWQCERGGFIQLTTLHALLDALNSFRREQNLNPLARGDVEWKIRGKRIRMKH